MPPQAAITLGDATDLVATAADKGKDFQSCDREQLSGGSNILSVAFSPGDLTVAAAWENGSNATWSPAACNAYVRMDMRPWLVGSAGAGVVVY